VRIVSGAVPAAVLPDKLRGTSRTTGRAFASQLQLRNAMRPHGETTL
jgi:hypothetical protein